MWLCSSTSVQPTATSRMRSRIEEAVEHCEVVHLHAIINLKRIRVREKSCDNVIQYYICITCTVRLLLSTATFQSATVAEK